MTKRRRKSPQVAVISLWKNDAERRIDQRATALLGKTYPNARFIWAVGDSTDTTEDLLRSIAAASPRDVAILTCETDDNGSTPDHRLQRLGETANVALDALTRSDKYVMVHESDLVSPDDVIERLLALPGDVGAGMVYLGRPPFFYDVYAYRKDGVKFAHDLPYHRGFKHHEPFEVDSVGSVWIAPAAEFVGKTGLRCNKGAVIDLMAGLRARDRHIFVDPSLTIIQPKDLWKAWQHGSA